MNNNFEKINVKELAEKLINSDLWLTMNQTESGIEVRFNDPNAINLISMFFVSNDELFKQIIEHVHLNKAMNKSMNDDISKRN